MNNHVHPIFRDLLNTAAAIGACKVIDGVLMVRGTGGKWVRLGHRDDPDREKYDDREPVTADETGHQD